MFQGPSGLWYPPASSCDCPCIAICTPPFASPVPSGTSRTLGGNQVPAMGASSSSVPPTTVDPSSMPPLHWLLNPPPVNEYRPPSLRTSTPPHSVRQGPLSPLHCGMVSFDLDQVAPPSCGSGALGGPS